MSSKKRKSPSEWQALIAEQEASGLSVAAFCRERGLVDKTFYHQRHKLGRALGPLDSPKPKKGKKGTEGLFFNQRPSAI